MEEVAPAAALKRLALDIARQGQGCAGRCRHSSLRRSADVSSPPPSLSAFPAMTTIFPPSISTRATFWPAATMALIALARSDCRKCCRVRDISGRLRGMPLRHLPAFDHSHNVFDLVAQLRHELRQLR